MNLVIEGNCLSGRFSRFEISTQNNFSIYMHLDLQAPVLIPLSYDNISVRKHLVSIGHKPRLDVVEHLFSALYGLGIFNVRIDVFGNEIPIFDGSSRDFVKYLNEIGEEQRVDVLHLKKRILIKEKDSFIAYEPSKKDDLSITMEFCHPYIETQEISLLINRENYIKEIAPARTFIFTDEGDPRLKDLPPYGIGVTKNDIYSSEPLRFRDEFVRHKVLDLLGDLYVLRKKIFGKITGRNTSHHLNLFFVRKLLAQG